MSDFLGPPVPLFLLLPSQPTDTNPAANSVVEGAAVNTQVGITAFSTDFLGFPITYSLASDNSGGGFKIDPTTGVVTVADPSKLDFESAPGHAYTITTQASDFFGLFTNTQTFTIAVTDVAPSTPVDANAAANSVAEGAANGTQVGITASSTDVNGPGVTYSLTGDTSGGGFTVNPTTGVVTVADSTKIDYETSPGHAYTVTVKASDGTLSSSQNFTIGVTDVPLPVPVDSNAAANSVTEGAAVGTQVGLTARANDPNGPVTVYSLIGDTSGGGFTINAATGVVTVADPTKIDFESAAGHAYTVTVKADDGLATTTQNFSIAVSDVAPSTPTDSNGAANTVAEGAANGTAVGITASSTDVNGPAVTYSLTGDSSGGGFTINAATGVVTVADSTKINFETAAGHAYTVTAQASDGTLTSSQTFAIAVTDVAPSTPLDSNAAANVVAEGAVAGTTVGVTASSTDVNGPAVTYSLTGDTSGGGFTINAATGVVSVADPSRIDYESALGHVYTVTAQASDGTLTSSQSFTIGVSDVAPSTPVDSNAAANTVAEGATNGTTVGVTAASTDVNGPPVAWSLIADSSGGGFAIDPTTGVVTVADHTKIDFESSAGAGHTYTVTAQASDGQGGLSSQNFVIAVTDVAPSQPTDSDNATNTVAEGAANGSTVGVTASSTDVNGPAVTYSLTGDTSGGGFTINAATGVVTVADHTKIDYETAPGHAYTVTAQASDGTLTSSQTFSIAVTDVAPSTPTDSDAATNTIAEGAANGSTVGVTASSTDVNGPAVTYSLTGDSSGGGFTINAATGVVTVADHTKIDYETAPGHAYTVTAQASDGTLTSSQTFSIAVTDVAPSTPTDSDAATNTIAEGAANGSTVGVTASSTDVNGPAVTYSLTGDTSGGGFTINAATGVVTVADSTKIDFESAPSHSYTVTAQASDGTLPSSTQTFTIAVTDVAPSTPADSDAASNTVAVGAPAGTYTGLTVSSTDVNGPAVSYSLVGDTSGGGFAVDATTGKVTIADPSKIVFNAGNPTFTVTADASDGTLHSQTAFTVNVVLDAAPIVTAGHTLAYTENQAATAFDPALTVTDSDNTNLDHATVQITGNYVNGQDVLGFTNQNGISGSFDAASGKLTLTGSSSVANYQTALDSVTYFNTSDNPSGAARTVTIIANDGVLDSSPATDTINVTPVNDPPVVVAGHTLSYTENQAATAIDSAITVSDVDNTTLASATVQITGNYVNGQDVLGFTNQNGISGTFDAASGKLTLTGSSSVANYQTALDSVTYFNSSDNPSGLARTVTIIANDGAANSTSVTDTINVTPVNDPPVVTAGHTLNYLENQAPTAIDNAITVSDVDNATLASATVQITGNYVNGEDVLGFTNQNGISGTFDAASGKLTLTGSSSVANYQTALDSVTYSDTSDNPSGLARTVTIIANDGAANSTAVTDTINVTPVNDAPVVTFGTINGFTEPPNGTPAANSAPVTIAPNLTVSDVDSTNLNSATFVLNDLKPSDALSVSGHAGSSGSIGGISFAISSTANTETVTFTGHDTIANYNAALDLVQFNNTSENPDTTARSYTVTAVDDGGTANGGNDTGSATTTETVTAVDDAPTATVPADSSVGTAFSHTNLAISGLSVADVDAGSGNVTATISASHASLAFDTTGLASFTNNNTHTVTLTGTVAQVNTALSSLAYNSDDGFTGSDTVTLNVNDNGNTGSGGPLSSGNSSFHVGVVPQVFYIDNTNGGPGSGAGTQADPFHSIAAFNTANPAGSGDYVVLEHGTGTYSEANGINLANGVNLIGGDESLSFTNPVTGATVIANTASGTAPVIKLTGGSDAGIDLLGTTGHIIEGVSVDTTAGSGIGISDDGNDVGAVTMSDIVVKTASGAGLNFTHGGTLAVTGSLNSIASTTGTALDISNTTIGAGNVTFHDISANGAVNGIVLNNTGSSGHLIVTGSGSTALGGDASGGTIQNTTGQAISLTNTNGPSFTNLNIHDVALSGINGTQVTNFTLTNSTITNVNTAHNTTDGDVTFNLSAGGSTENNLSGAVSITGNTLNNSWQDGISINNYVGTISNLTITGNSLTSVSTLQSGSAGTAIKVLAQQENGSTAAQIAAGTISSNTVNNFPGGGGIVVHGGSTSALAAVNIGSSANHFKIDGNTITGAGTGLAGIGTNGIEVTIGDKSNGYFNIGESGQGNTITNVAGDGIAGSLFGTGTALYDIGYNTIDAHNTANSPGINTGADSAVNNADTPTLFLNIHNNTVSNTTGNGIISTIRNADGTGYFKIDNNTVNQPIQGTTAYGIRVDSGNGSEATGATVILEIQGNTTAGGKNGSGTIQAPGIGLRENHLSGSTGTFEIVGLTPTSANDAQMEAYVGNAGQNPGSANGTFGATGVASISSGATFTAGTLPGFPLFAASGGVQAASPTSGEMHLAQSELDSVIAAAIAQWAAAGASASQLAALHATTFSVADLSSGTIGEESSPAHVTIDINADGHGWFVDPTPRDNFEFTHAQNAAGTDLLTDPTSAAAGHLDLLTTVTHELGHVLGLPDSTAAADAHDLMYIDLVDGERRLPDAADVAQANAAQTGTDPTQASPSVAQQTSPSVPPTPTSLAQAAEAALPGYAQAGGAPIVVGTAGNDTIDAGYGGKILFGGGGADNFVFGPNIHPSTPAAPSAQPITHVADYSATQGDTFDFTALTSAFHDSTVADVFLVRAVEDGSGKFATLQLNTTPDIPVMRGAPPSLPGAGATWANIAQIDSAHSGDAVNVLVDSHSAVHLAQIHVDLLV